MSRERLLILFGPSGLDDLTRRASRSVEAVAESYPPVWVDEVVAVGKELGVLPSDTRPLRLPGLQRDGKIVEEVENFLNQIRDG